MSDNDLPVVKFDDNAALRIFPRPELKTADFVQTPRTQDGSELPTVIQAEWGQPQMFLGDFYVIVRDGVVVYGSAAIQWRFMHTEMEPGRWVKTGIPLAYQATEHCTVVTLIMGEDNSIREAKTVVNPGDWVVKQPGGEVQHIRAAKYPTIYFTAQEAQDLGLVHLTSEQFAAWAVAHIKALALV